jgi:trigger factor
VTAQAKEFKNDHLQVSVSREPGSKVKLQINVAPAAAQAAYKKAIKNVNNEVTMPGFRKGKAPEKYIVDNYKKHVDQEWNDILINTAFQEALELVKIFPFGKNSVQRTQIKEISQDKGASFVVEYEAEPEVPEINFDELTVKKVEKTEVTPERIQDVITQIQLSNAQWENVDDQTIAEGDYVDLDIDNLDEGFEICRGSRFAVEKGKMGTWLVNLLEGKKVNDVLEGVSELDHAHAESCNDPTHDHSHDAEFKPTKCRVTIKAHLKAKLPTLDDELAVKVGAPNVEELNKRIVQSLEKSAADLAHESQHRQIEDELIKQYSFDIPESLTREEKKQRIEHSLEHLNPEGMTREDYEQKSKEIAEKVSRNLDNAYRLFFIANKVAQDHHIEVSQEDIMQEFMKQMMNQDTSIINQNMQPDEIRSRLYSYLITRKAKDLMVQKARQID